MSTADRSPRGRARYKAAPTRTLCILAAAGVFLSTPAVHAQESVSTVGLLSITADTRTGGSAQAFTVLATAPVITETAAGDIANSATIVITAPTDFNFNTGQVVTATPTSGGGTVINLGAGAGTPQTATPQASTITFTVAAASITNPSTITFTDIQIRPINCTGATTGTFNATVVADGGAPLNGATFATITVTNGVADDLIFSAQPANTASGVDLVPAVTVQDACNNTVTNDERLIILSIQTDPNSGSAKLGGALSRTTVSGVATWVGGDDMNIDLGGTGYVLRAVHGGADFATSDSVNSNTFNITGDSDSDGIPDGTDNCPNVSNLFQTDSDGDGDGDSCDNCVTVANADQADSNSDGVGDACTFIPPAPTPPSDTTVTPPPDTTPPPTIEPQPPVTESAGDTGVVVVSNDAVDVLVTGLEGGTDVTVETSETGETTVTVGSADNPDLTVSVDGLGEGGDIDVSIDENGDQSLQLVDADGNEALSLSVEGVGVGAEVDVSIDANGDQDVTVTRPDGSTITMNLNSLPDASNVTVTTDAEGNVSVAVTDPSGNAVDVTVDVTNAGENVTFTVTYNAPPEQGTTGKVFTGFPGFVDGESLGGSVDLAATGTTDDSVITVTLEYEDADLEGLVEADLRVQKLNTETEVYEPAGTNDVGDSMPTGVLGDFGVYTDSNTAWAEVSELGTFAVGIPEAAPVAPDDDGEAGEEQGAEEAEEPAACGAGAAPCGMAGMLTWFLIITGLVAMRRRA